MRFLLILALIAPSAAFAAGGGTTTAPKPTNTTKKCLFGRVWDADAGKCVKPDKTNLSDDTLYQAVRELAYDGQYQNAQTVLRAMTDQADDRVLTYWGFTYRKLGHPVLADMYYTRAIIANPDNILARSYMGQGMVESGDIDGAIAQWREIKARGGGDTWAEVSLRNAIRTGSTYSH